MKRGKLSKVEEFFIKNNEEMSVEEVASELDRSVDFVNKKRKEFGLSVEEKPKKKKKETEFKKTLVNKTEQGREGITIMTRAGSERIDEHKKKMKSKIKKGRKTGDAIFNPLDEE